MLKHKKNSQKTESFFVGPEGLVRVLTNALLIGLMLFSILIGHRIGH